MQTIVERPSASGGAPRHQKLFHGLVGFEVIHVGSDDLGINVNREVYSHFHFFPLGRLRGLSTGFQADGENIASQFIAVAFVDSSVTVDV